MPFYVDPSGEPADRVVGRGLRLLPRTQDPGADADGASADLTDAILEGAKTVAGGRLLHLIRTLVRLQGAGGGEPVAQTALLRATQGVGTRRSDAGRKALQRNQSDFLGALGDAPARIIRLRDRPRPPAGYTNEPVYYLLVAVERLRDGPSPPSQPSLTEAGGPGDDPASARSPGAETELAVRPSSEASNRPPGAGRHNSLAFVALAVLGCLGLAAAFLQTTSSSVGASPCGAPRVDGVAPLTAPFQTRTQFTVSGACLPDTTAAWIDSCRDLRLDAHRPDALLFSCVPDYTVGMKGGVVKDRPGGTRLLTFVIHVASQPPTSPP